MGSKARASAQGGLVALERRTWWVFCPHHLDLRCHARCHLATSASFASLAATLWLRRLIHAARLDGVNPGKGTYCDIGFIAVSVAGVDKDSSASRRSDWVDVGL